MPFNETNKTKEMVLIGMFSALIGVLSQLIIPMPSGVPVTLQTFAVALAGVVLGWKRGLIATVVYILIGMVGIPVFSGMGAGPGVLLGKTGGFLFGFLILCPACGLINKEQGKWYSYVIGLVGLLICHLAGVTQFTFLMKMSLWQSAMLVSIPFLLKDALSVGLAIVAGKMVSRTLYRAGILV